MVACSENSARAGLAPWVILVVQLVQSASYTTFLRTYFFAHRSALIVCQEPVDCPKPLAIRDPTMMQSYGGRAVTLLYYRIPQDPSIPPDFSMVWYLPPPVGNPPVVASSRQLSLWG